MGSLAHNEIHIITRDSTMFPEVTILLSMLLLTVWGVVIYKLLNRRWK